MGSKVVYVEGRIEWDRLHASAAKEKKLLVADFTATWCGPCRVMAPVLDELSMKYPQAFFLKVDVDKNADIAAEFGVRGIPAFHFYKGGKKVEELVGADQGKLRALVERLYESPTFTGQARTLAGTGSSSSAPPSAPSEELYDESQLDPTKPCTSIQFRLPDGSRLVGKFNLDAPAGKLHAFVKASRPSLAPTFKILNSFPPRPLESYEKTIQELGLVNASLQITL